MAYVLRPTKSLPDEIRRVMLEQIDNALAHLLGEIEGTQAVHVHETRKRFKQIRAILRLIRYEIGEETYAHENGFYRDLARRLAPLRERYVLIEALDKLLDQIETDDLKRDANKIREALVEQYEITQSSMLTTSNVLEEVAEALQAGRERVNDWALEKDKFKAIKPGLKRIYRQGKKRMAPAYDDILSAVAFHEWRKSVKYLWYQMRLLREVNPEIISPIIADLDVLADYLGDAHDLAELYEAIASHPAAQDGGGRRLLAQIDYQRARLEHAAHPLGEKLYQESAGAFTKTIKSFWREQREKTTA